MSIKDKLLRLFSGVLTFLAVAGLCFSLFLNNNRISATEELLTAGQQNIVKRAYQMTNIQWTPKANITGWGGGVTYKAGKTYTGLPYGQPVNASYVPWSTSLDGFIQKVNDPNSKMYTSTSTYNQTAPYYSIDCSAFVSWAWGLGSRQTTSTIHNYATKISTSSYANAQVGDCLCLAGSHVVLITDITYDSSGKIDGIEISESTVNSATYYCCQKTRYGKNGSYTLEKLSSKYFGAGYILYRSKTRDSVTYAHCCAVPLEGDVCSLCDLSAAKETPCQKNVSGITDVQLYAEPFFDAEQIGSVIAGTKIVVTAYWEDDDGILWYKTEDGRWLLASLTEPYCEHSYEYRVLQPSNCTEDGIGLYICSLCSDSYPERIPAKGHSYVSYEVLPECEKAGYTEHYCTTCADVWQDSEMPPTGHSYQNGVCTHCGKQDLSILKGDLNDDREITSADAVLLARYLADLLELNEKQLLAADISNDGEITSADAVLLARHLAEIL